jgi:uncharacterized RDD family membrane protein YckC
VTPEGTALPFPVASAFDRVAALVTDFALVFAGGIVVLLLALPFMVTREYGRVIALVIIANFVLRNFYFSFFEILGGGATPGKRLMKLRVVSRSGGPLEAESVLVRNLTREFECFIPLTVLSSPEALMPWLPGAGALLGSLWLLVGASLPLFNRDRLRLGDLLGGTIVVSVPRTLLLDDPAMTGGAAPRRADDPVYAFSEAQLDQYGIEELQVLEGLLRRDSRGPEREVLRAVTDRITDKIGWPEQVQSANIEKFLTAFYLQLRARREHKALFGDRQERKRAGKLAREAGHGAAPVPGTPPLEPPPAPPTDPPVPPTS